MSIFTSLEEKNLEIIKKSQDTEYSLELRKQQDIKMKKKFGGIVSSLEQNQHDLIKQIQESQLTLNELKKQNKQAETGDD